MSSKYIPAFIMLAAGALTSILCIINKIEAVYSLKLLLGTLVIFFIIGLIAQKILNKVVESNRNQKLLKDEKEKETKEAPQEEEEQEEGKSKAEE